MCSYNTFLWLKIVKNGYWGNGGFIFAWDLGISKWVVSGFLEKVFGLEGAMEKCVGCFLVYLFQAGFFSLKARYV